MRSTIKLLSVIEATTVTGPAKSLLNFCRLMRSPHSQEIGLPRVEVSIVTFHRSRGQANGNGLREESTKSSPNAFVAAARAEGINVDVIHESFRFQPTVIRRLREVVTLRAPDIIQTHMIKSHFLIKLAGLANQYPWIAYHHGYTTTDLKMELYNQLNRWSLPSATRVITVCDAFAGQLTRAGVRPDRISVCHNSIAAPRRVTNDEKRDLKHRLGIAGNERVVLAVGRLSREKGHVDLISALAMLRDLDAALRFKLLIVGEGPERERVERAAYERGLDLQVLFIGHVADVAPYYAIADALALPSHSEGSPNVLLEAMAAGLPAVATNVGGVPEIAIANESALLVPARNPRLFAEALHRILTNSELAQTLSTNAKARVAAHFSPESQAQSVVRIYQELMPEIVSEPRTVTRGSYSNCVPDTLATPTGRGSET